MEQRHAEVDLKYTHLISTPIHVAGFYLLTSAVKLSHTGFVTWVEERIPYEASPRRGIARTTLLLCFTFGNLPNTVLLYLG